MRSEAAFLMVFGFTLLVSTTARAGENDQAVALWADGQASYQTQDSTDWTPLQPGTSLPEGSRIKTEGNSSCGLALEGNYSESSLVLNSDSSAQLDDLGPTGHVDLSQGSIFVKLRSIKSSTFEVSTPTAVAAVRGTGWLQSKDRLDVFDGTVQVRGVNGQEELVTANESVDISFVGDLTKKPADPSGLSTWQDMILKAESSPYFGRIRANDVLELRHDIDQKRASNACGSLPKRAWESDIEAGGVVASAQLNELKTALSEPPFKQSPDFVSDYLDPITERRPGEKVSKEHLRLLREAVDQAKC